MPETWANNAGSTLAVGISDSALSLEVQSGHGARFPSPTMSDFFYATLDDGVSIEIVQVTARAADVFTIVRAQQGTAASSFAAGTRVELRITAASLGSFTAKPNTVHGRTGDVVGVLGDYTPSLLPVLTTGTPAGVTTLEGAFRRMWSAGSVSGFDLTDNGDGTVTVAAGEGLLRIAAASDAELRSVSCPGGSPALTNNAVNYIYFEWNGGTPQLGVTTSVSGFNCQDACLLYTIAREGSVLSILDGRRMNVDGSRKLRRQLFETERLRRVQGGTTLGNAGTRRITVTSGAFYYALNRLDHVTFDTTVAGTALANVFTYRYRNGSGGWTTIDNAKQINNTQYDDGTGTLATLGNNRYRTDWVYLIPGTNARLIVVLGRNESNSLAAAQAVAPPSDLPPLVSSSGVLIGRVVILRDATEIASVASAFDATFVFAPVVAHADLSGLQGGDVGERYHLNLAQHTDAVAVSAVGNDRIVYRDPGGDIVGLDPATIGGGGAPSIVVVEGFDASNSYRSAVDQLPGADGFTAIWYGYLFELIHGAPQFLMGNHNMSGHGWAIIAGSRAAGSAAYLQFEVRDGSGPVGVSSEILEAQDFAAFCMQPLHLAIRYAGGFARGFVNGQATRFEGTGTGYTAASGARFTVGNNPGVWNEPATRAGFAGAGYIASGLTNAQIQDHFQACREADNRFVAGAVSWAHRYDVRSPGGSFPTQIDDLEGSAHLERVGTAITSTTTRRV